ncbi:uncharacterized protein LOC132284377 [Cornus florida]|uniref:uncharacterized protein LOC132284377 n=1 Tax=Cornus florida TaxID=4283 RepID=UPI0028A11517|nr:uncharacterized protein LOC132284377 [Cornus florida]
MQMDGFHFDNLKVEKANAMLRYRRLREIAKLFRFVELCIALVFLSWTSARLPFAVRISGEYFRQLIAIIVSPTFIFVLGNMIVITLIAKSSRFSAKTPISEHSETDLYDEFIRNSENRINFRSENFTPVTEPEEIVYQDKQIICEANTVITPNSDANGLTKATDTISESKAYRRSQSENLKRENSEKPCGKFRRSETEKCRKLESSGEIPAETVDKLSNEEFQRTIEEFIAKQVRFRQEEKMAIVLHNHS